MVFVKSMKKYWRTILVLLLPVVLSPLIFPYSQRTTESKCSFVVIVVMCFYLTEALPLPMTSLLPLALCPLLGICASKLITKLFFSEVHFLAIGSLFVAAAIEKTMLHKRLALTVLAKIGVQPRRLMFGLMLITACLSMWINNTAAAAMMMPITNAVLDKLYDGDRESEHDQPAGVPLQLLVTDAKFQRSSLAEDEKRQLSSEAEDKPLLNVVNDHTEEMNLHAECSSSQPPRLDATNHSIVSGVDGPSQGYLCQSDTIQPPPSSPYDVREEMSTNNPSSKTSFGEQGVYEGKEINPYLNFSTLSQVERRRSPEQLAIQEPEKQRGDTKSPSGPSYDSTVRIFSLCIAYAANAGGIATLIGTPPNLVLAQYVNTLSEGTVINFAQWMALGLPITAINLILIFIWLNICLYGIRATMTLRPLRDGKQVAIAYFVIKDELNKMGKMKYKEKVVAVHFLALIVLWLTREPGFVSGWAAVLPHKYITDAVTAMAVCLSLFIFSDERPNVFCFRRADEHKNPKSMPSVLTWKAASSSMPWGLLFLLGGGFALANAIQISGLSKVITSQLLGVQHMPEWVACVTITCFACIATEFVSNTVLTILLLPILKDVAIVLEVHPMYLMLPATLAASLAFMLPVATPPNALVYSYGKIKISDMLKCGIVPNIMGLVMIMLACHTWAWTILNLGTVPDWSLVAISHTSNPADVGVVNMTINASLIPRDNNFVGSTSSYGFDTSTIE